jgi:hypothetical protein
VNTFSQIASFITARGIQKPLAVHAEADQNAYRAYLERLSGDEEGIEKVDRISLVIDGHEPIGWWWPYEEDVQEGDTKTVSDCMTPITCAMLVSGDAKYLELADLFAQQSSRFLYFVLEGTKITGTVSFGDLFCPLGRLCLFSLVLHLEKEAEELCKHKAETCFNVLSEGRQEKAHEVLAKCFASSKHNSGVEKYRGLIESTTFIDKGKMLGKAQLINNKSRNEIESVFAAAEKVRNSCAHNRSEFQVLGLTSNRKERRNLSTFIHKTQEMIGLIQKGNADWLS